MCPLTAWPAFAHSKQQFEINKWNAPVACPANLTEPAFDVEGSGARSPVVRVEMNRLAGPRPAYRLGLFEEVSSDTLTLLARLDRHVDQVQRPSTAHEVCPIDGPRLFREQPQRRDDGGAVACDQHARRLYAM